MSGFNRPNGTGAPPDPDYEWRYEYYDDEPVSFEGLKAHRYSIVIGFWVGLAVFVIFMFFVLTLLTKTGAPHPDGGEPCEKRVRLAACADLDDAAPPPCPRGPPSSRSLFQCFVTEEDRGSAGAPWEEEEEEDGMVLQEEPAVTGRESVLLAHFNIPNFVNSEQSSTLGEDELLLGEPELPITLEGRGHTGSSHYMTE
ncbi:melanocortin-2 receptor accessory protein 2A [Centroberyx gerrardi]